MANNYDIIMKQFNGEDYNTLFPASNSKQIDVDTDLKNKLGLSANSTLFDVLPLFGAMKVGSYNGAGTNSKSLTFDFVPKFGVVLSDGGFAISGSNNALYGTLVWITGITEQRMYSGSTTETMSIAVNNKTITFSTTGTHYGNNLDASGTTYYYAFFG